MLYFSNNSATTGNIPCFVVRYILTEFRTRLQRDLRRTERVQIDALQPLQIPQHHETCERAYKTLSMTIFVTLCISTPATA